MAGICCRACVTAIDSAIGLTALGDDASASDKHICGEAGKAECTLDCDRLCVSLFGPDDWTKSEDASDWKDCRESTEFVLGEDSAEESVDTAKAKLDEVSWVIGHS